MKQNKAAFEWYNSETGHCYVDYVERPEMGENNGYTKTPLYHHEQQFSTVQLDLKNKILSEYERGRIVVSSIDGLASRHVNDFLNQPVDGLLYDLNRGEETVLAFINDPKWINDFAVCKTIRAFSQKLIEAQNKIQDLEKRLN